MALAQYTDTIFQANGGGAYPGVKVEALSGSTPVQLYLNSSGVPVNEVITDANGLFSFWINEGTYVLRFSRGGSVLGTQADVAIYNKANAAALGTDPTALNMGGFSGGIYLPNQTVKQLFQQTETSLAKAPLQVGLFTDIATTTIPANVQQISTVGQRTAGIGPAIYSRYTGPSPAASPIMTQDAGGNWWYLAPSQETDAAMFGLITDGTATTPTDSSARINSVLAGGNSASFRRRFNFGQNFNVRGSATGGITVGAETIVLQRDVSMEGDGWSSKVFVNKDTTIPYLFGLNTTGNQAWITAFPGALGAVYGNFYADARAAATNGKYPSAFDIGLSAHIHNIHMLGFAQGGRQISSYIDQIYIDRPNVQQEEDGSGRYYWDLQSAGDGCIVDSAHMSLKFITPGVYTNAPRGRNVRMRYKVGSRIAVSINGDHELYGCDGIETYGFHQEFGQFRVISSSAVLRGHNFWTHGSGAPNLNVPPVYVGTIPGVGNISPGSVRLEDLGFILQQGFHGGYNKVGDPDIYVDWPWYGDLIIDRCFRKSRPLNVSPAMAMQYGCLTNDPMFNRYSHIASYYSQYNGGHLRLFDTLDSLPLPSGGLSTSLSVVSDMIGIWEIAGGTFYYKIADIYDEPRKIGNTTGNEVQLTLATGGGGAQLVLETVGRRMVRFYRGTSSGVYDKYVDVPVMVGFRPCDLGNDIGGFPWLSRTPGPADSWNVGSVEEYNIQPGDPRASDPLGSAPNAYGRATIYYRSDLALPTMGEFHWGDTLVRRVPSNVTGRRFKEYYRLTNGTGHVLGTDWREIWEFEADLTGTTSTISTAGSPINQPPFKKAGLVVFNTSVNKPFWATGSSPTSTWVDATGAVAYTPT